MSDQGEKKNASQASEAKHQKKTSAKPASSSPKVTVRLEGYKLADSTPKARVRRFGAKAKPSVSKAEGQKKASAKGSGGTGAKSARAVRTSSSEVTIKLGTRPKPKAKGPKDAKAKPVSTAVPGPQSAKSPEEAKTPKPSEAQGATGKAKAPKVTTQTPTPGAGKAPKPTVSTPSKAKMKVKVAAQAAVPKEQAQSQQQNMTSVRKSIVFLAAVGIIYILYLVMSGQMDEFVQSLAQIDRRWVLIGVLVYAFYYVFGVTAYVVGVVNDKDSPVGIRDLMSVEATGIFFSNLTPNGMGGAPAQIYRLTHAGLSVGNAGALQYTRFIVYEAAEGIFAALMLIFRYNYFIDTYGNVALIGALLFGFKILEVVGLTAICLFPRVSMSVGNAGLGLLNRLHLVKDYDHLHETINTQITEFSNGFKSASTNIGSMIFVTIDTLLQLGCLYALPFVTLRAFGREADLVTCLACGSMLELLTSAIPLPGGTGGAEGGFAFLFGWMFGSDITAGYVVWRMLEYFLPTLVAVPLMGLRSYGNGSLHSRWQRFRRVIYVRWKHFLRGDYKKTAGKLPGGQPRGAVRVRMGRKHRK